MKTSEIMANLKSININVRLRTLQIYVKQELIPRPEYPEKGQGAQAHYAEDTVERIFAIHNLMSLRSIPMEKMKFIVRVGDHLAKQKYTSYADVINDETDDEPLSWRMGEYGDLAFFTIEYLRLKNFARGLLRPGISLPFGEEERKFETLSDRQTLYSIMAGPTAEKEPVKFVTQGLLVAIANGESEILSQLE
jgi:hypothetical protein